MSRQADLLEAYHNILYVINNAPLNSYPKFGKNDVKKIPSDKAEKIIGNVVGHRLASIPADKHRMSNWFWGIRVGQNAGGRRHSRAAIPESILKLTMTIFCRLTAVW